jgi:RNA polymerase sigma-70 factor (ECF subfamily)
MLVGLNMSEKETLNPEQWVRAYADELYAFALKRIKDPELCKDLVQDTFVSAIRNLSTYQGSSSERTWLTSILKNKIIDSYRKKASHTIPGEHVSAEEDVDTFFEANGHWKTRHAPQSWAVEAVTPMEQEELTTVLEACMEKLPKTWGMVFRLKYVEEEDSDKIRKELDLSASNYWVIVHRAKLHLRACLEKNWLKSKI